MLCKSGHAQVKADYSQRRERRIYMRNCETCERRNKQNPKKCIAFRFKPKNCWAYTNDKDWLRKVIAAVKKYKDYKNGYIEPYWR